MSGARREGSASYTEAQHEPYEIQRPEVSIGDLVGELTSQFGELVKDHIDLARVEITEEIRTAGRGAGLISGAAVAGMMALVALTLAAGWGLAEVMHPGWAFLIVTAVWAVITAVLAAAGKNRLDNIEPPRRTTRELKEDREWIRQSS